MQTLDQVLMPLKGMTDSQLKPYCDAVGLSVHTVRNQVAKTKRGPRLDTYLKLVEISRRIMASGGKPGDSTDGQRDSSPR